MSLKTTVTVQNTFVDGQSCCCVFDGTVQRINETQEEITRIGRIAKKQQARESYYTLTLQRLSLPCSGLVKKPATFVLQTLNQCLEVTWETFLPALKSISEQN